MSARQLVLRSARRAVIAGASALAIAGAAGGADLLGQARADGPQCDPNPAVACPPGDSPTEPAVQSATRPHERIICQPARIGAFCYHIKVH